MKGGRWARLRGLRGLGSRIEPSIAPAIVLAICGLPVASALRKMTYAILGRDQGIFQYRAWALLHGLRDYVDLHEINGPLGPLVHLGLIGLGGADEHRFRCLDVAVSSVVFFLVGTMLPGIARSSTSPSPRWPRRVLWGMVTWAVLGAQYVVFGWWETSQRESFYDLFLLGSIACQIHASRPADSPATGRVIAWTASSALGALTWFGKPTCAIFSGLQAAVALLDRHDPTPRRLRLAAMALGWLGASVGMVGFIAFRGDVGAFIRIVLLETPRLYGPIWHKSAAGCYAAWGNAPKLNYAFATLFSVVCLSMLRLLPMRLYVPATLLIGGLLTFFLQGKGFPYHLHAASAGARLLWIAALAAVGDRLSATRHRCMHAVPVIMAIAIGWQCRTDAVLSSYARSDWDSAGATPMLRASRAYVQRFPWGDFFAWDLRSAADFLARTTENADRVQLYGMDPYVLFLARRMSASPYIYSFELNVDASLEGGDGGRPGAAEREWIVATAHRHQEEMQSALAAAPPAAFVLIDDMPFTYPADAEVDFAQHCPVTYRWMLVHYRRAARLGAVRVWLRADTYDRAIVSGALPI